MTQPVPELRSQPIGGETTTATVAGAPERDLFYVRSPVTGDVRGVTAEQAQQLVFRSGWEPVVEPAAERLLQRQLLREGASPWSAAGYGAIRGLTGGLSEFAMPQGEEPGAMALQAIREEHPYISAGAEIGGTFAPFLAPLRGVKLLTLPGLAEAGGAAVTRGLAGQSPGVARAIAARVGGMAFEGGAQGTAYNAGESAIEDTPLTAQKLSSGFLMGALPGAILGAPIGAAEGLVARYALKGGLLRENLARPGVDDLDLMQIAQREHGVAAPGLGEELAANMNGVSPELVKLAGDNGPIGQQVKRELVEAPQLREAAEKRAAEALNGIRDLDEVAINGVAGRMKAEQVRKWIPAGEEQVGLPDAQQAVMDALRADSPEEVVRKSAQTVAPPASAPNIEPIEKRIVDAASGLKPWAEGSPKIYISDLAEKLGVSVSELAPYLIRLDQETPGGILARIDLVQAADRAKLDASSVRHLNAEYQAIDKNALSKIKIQEPPAPGKALTPAPVMTPELRAARANYARATGRMERQQIEDAALEQYGEDAARYVRGEKALPLNIPPRAPIPSRGAVATVEFAPGREGELARAFRAGKMADVLIRWADEAPEVAASLRNNLAAGPSQSSLRKAIRRALGNGDESFMQVFQTAYEGASPEARAALGKRLLNAGHQPGMAPAQGWKAHALDLVDELANEADSLALQAKGVVGKKASGAGEIRALLTDARAKIITGDKAAAFIELDYLKKRLGKYAAPGEYLGADQNVAAMARRQYEDLRSTLENPMLWGEKAALAQKDINRIFTARINRANVFFDKFYVDSGKAHPDNPWIRQREATAESVRKGLDGIIDPAQSREYQAFKQHIAESRDVLANLKKHYALSGGDAGKLGQWSRAIDDAEKAFTEASHYARREAQASKLFSNQAKLIPGWGKWVAMHFLGPAGFLAVAAAERATNPGARIYARAVLERTLRQSESRVARAVTKILTGKTVRLEGVGATQLAAKGAVSLLRDRPEKRKDSYASTLRELAQLTDPQVATQQAAKAMPFAAMVLPAFPQHIGNQLSTATQYLLNASPQKPRWTPDGIVVPQPSDTELHEFEARMRGALDPLTVFEDAGDGESVPMAQVEAAERVAPELMDHVRLLVLDELSNGGHKLSYHKTIVLSRVLGVDLDRTLEPEYINAQQMVYAGRAKAMPNPSDDRSTGEESGVNKEYRMTKDQKIESGVPAT